MRNDGQKNGFIPSSFRALSSYLRIASSGASTVASTVRSAASSIVDRAEDARYDQVLWAGFDKLEFERDVVRRVLLLGCRSGFQVWDVEEVDNILDLVSRHDGPVSFLQMLPNPLSTLVSKDKFSDSRPLLAVCTDKSLLPDGVNLNPACNGSLPATGGPPLRSGYYGASTVKFYSLTCQSYVHVLKFRSLVYSVRCGPRVVAVSLAAQVHCFNAASLEREYTILTSPVQPSGLGSGGMGYGPLALGPRWLAYSGNLVEVSNGGSVSPQHITPLETFPSAASNGKRVAHYAKESSKHLAAGIVTLGDIGYKKLSQYCAELLPDSSHSLQSEVVGAKANGSVNHHPSMNNVGVVIIKDIVSKDVVTQFRAHKSPISALCFDPTGVLLVTASIHGHNINIFRIFPRCSGNSSGTDFSASYVHLYRLQRGLTNAIIQDITFSNDSRWIMISSSRGTNHLFAISPFGGTVDIQFEDSQSNALNVTSNAVTGWQPNSAVNQQNLFTSGPPVTLSVVGRIRNGNNGWKATVNGAAAVATSKNNSLSGAIAAVFHLHKDKDVHVDGSASKSKYHLLIFSPSGWLIQYALRISVGLDTAPGNDSKLIIEAIQKWNMCQKHWKREDNFDIYGENGFSDSNKIFPEVTRKGNPTSPVSKYMTTKSKLSLKERNFHYISQAELQMHEQQQVPLWERSEICFESMMTDGVKLCGEDAGGEIEIEKIRTRTIEVRSKDSVPLFDYLYYPRSQMARISASDSIFGSQAKHKNVLGLSQSCALGSMTKNDGELHGGIPFKCADVGMGSVNTNDRPKNLSRLQTVNIREREHLKMEGHLRIVNSNGQAFKTENQFEDEGDEFD